jgi:hypothetical protein
MTSIYDELVSERYHQPEHHQPQEAPVSLATDIHTGIEDAKHFLEDHLGGVLQRASALENSPVVQALEMAALGPAGEALVVDFISKLASFASAVVPPAAPAETAALADAEVPGEPLPAGPVVGGQAQ